MYNAFHVNFVYTDSCVFFWLSVINSLKQDWKNAPVPEFTVVISGGKMEQRQRSRLKGDIRFYLNIFLHCLNLLQQNQFVCYSVSN